MVRTQIQLTEEQSQQLKSIAHAQDVSVAELIRRSVDLYLQTHVDRSYEEQKQRALEVVGKYASDIEDTSVNHDKYLAEIYAEVKE